MDEQLEATKDVLERNEETFRDISQTLDVVILLNMK